MGLALTIKPFRIEIQNDIAQLVTDGKVDFAVGKENLILEQAQHKKIIALYAIFQSSPLAIFSTRTSHINTFKDFLEKKYGVKVVIGTHPIPQKYVDMHAQLGSWDDPAWKQRLSASLIDESTRKAYN